MKLLKHLAAGALLLVVSQTCFGATYYVSDCQTGVSGATPGSGCVAGNDSNSNAQAQNPSTPWRTVEKARTFFASLQRGDKILFAQGGVWSTTDSPNLINTNALLNCMADSCAVGFDSYSAGFGSAKPIIYSPSGNAFAFHLNNTTFTNGGYFLRNVDIRGPNSGTTYGVLIGRPLGGLRMDGISISRFYVGILCYDESGGTGTSTQTLHSRNIHLTNSTLDHNVTQGLLWGCNGLISKNNFSFNGQDNDRDHQNYFGAHWDGPADFDTRSNLVVEYNTYTESGGSSNAAGSVCPSPIIVVHGRWKYLAIRGNKIIQASGAANTGCWGIGVDTGYVHTPAEFLDERFDKVEITGNTLVNIGGIGIGCAGCIAPKIENNLIIQEAANIQTAGIQVPDRTIPSGAAADTGATIRFNTIWFKQVSAGYTGIVLRDDPSHSNNTAGSNLTVDSNVIVFASTSDTTHRCFDSTLSAPSAFTSFDKNTCYDTSANGGWDARGTPIDTNRITTDPQLTTPTSANSWNAAPTNAASPVVNAGSASAPKGDIRGCRRSSPDRGAFEYYSGTCTKLPATPTGVR